MTDPNGPKDTPEQPAEAAEPVVSKPYIMPDDPEPNAAEALAKEAAEARDRMLRTLAEMENLRKRTAKEVADARTYGVANFAREMLPFADNLRRAADSVPAEARATLDPIATALLEGLEVTARDFMSRLGRFGVKQIEALGAKFDPNLHEALYEIPDESQPAGTVAQVMEQGYMIGERVLRPAKVGVTRGGPKA
jgi:molecular chaperone GrpE